MNGLNKRMEGTKERISELEIENKLPNISNRVKIE